MKLPFQDFFRKRGGATAWVYKTEGVVWRLVPTEAGVFVGEDRLLHEKRVSFFCLDRATGSVAWERVTVGEKWWVGIEAVHRDRVFLHGFSQPDIPDRKGIVALDLTTGRPAWSNMELRYLLAADESVFASKDTFAGRVVHELDFRTGSTLRTWENDPEEMKTAVLNTQGITNTGVLFPSPFDERNFPEEVAHKLVHKYCPPGTVVGAIDLLEYEDMYFYSYHEKEDQHGRLQHLLRVADKRTGSALFSESLDRNLRSATPDSFFVQDRMLYFVKDRSLLTAVAIQRLKRQAK